MQIACLHSRRAHDGSDREAPLAKGMTAYDTYAEGIPELGRFVFPMLGEGRVDWRGMFAALEAIGYEGYCSVEFESFDCHANVLGGDTREAARRSLADARALMSRR